MSTATSTRVRRRRRWLGVFRMSPAIAAKRRIQAALLLLVALLAGVIAAGVIATMTLYRSAENRYVHLAQPLQTATRDVLFRVTEEETAVRGYMITQNRASLRPYFEGRTALAQDLRLIRRLAKGREPLADRTAAVARQAQSLHGFYDRLIVFVADGKLGQDVARRDVLDAERLADGFRATARSMQFDIEALVADTRSAQHQTYVATLAILGVGGALALAIAITLLVRVPERLRRAYAEHEQEAQASSALAHVSEGVFVVSDEDVVRYWNRAAETIFAVAEDDAVGRPVRAVVPDYDEIVGAAEAGDSFVPVVADGTERWLAPAVTAFDGGSVVAVRDATAGYQLERARTDFVATASHELRTPLTSVYGGATTLLARGEELGPGRRNALLRMIADESAHLTQIVDQLLVSAQLDRGTLRIDPQQCDIGEVCRAVVDAARTRAPVGVIVALELSQTLSPVRCDAALLRQVLVNLVDNAIKYSVDGGLVLVRAREEPETTTLEVVDHGLGIPIAEQERIFEKFYRLDAEMTGGVGGSGLGLYISREIVTQLGGMLMVRSELGRGSTFSVTLPRLD